MHFRRDVLLMAIRTVKDCRKRKRLRILGVGAASS